MLCTRCMVNRSVLYSNSSSSRSGEERRARRVRSKAASPVSSGNGSQQNLEGGQQQNRFSAVKCLCLLVSRARQGGRHAAAAARPLQTGGFDGGTRKIGGQTQDRDLLKLLFPILLGALSGWGAQPLLL